MGKIEVDKFKIINTVVFFTGNLGKELMLFQREFKIQFHLKESYPLIIFLGVGNRQQKKKGIF